MSPGSSRTSPCRPTPPSRTACCSAGTNNSAFAPQLLATQAGPALSKNYWVASPSLPIGADDVGFGSPQDFSDPKAPSSKESVILQPDKSVTGGMKVVRESRASSVAEGCSPAE